MKHFCYLVIPVEAHFAPSKVTEAARCLLDSALEHAFNLTHASVELLAVNAEVYHCWDLGKNQLFPSFQFHRRGLHSLINIGSLLFDDLPIEQLKSEASQHGIAWCGVKSTQDTYACTFISKFLRPKIPAESLWAIITYLTATPSDNVDTYWQQIAQLPLVLPSGALFERSPTVSDIFPRTSHRRANSPQFLNTAVKEMVCMPCSLDPVHGDPLRMSQVLMAQRDASQVPWVFNTLLNDLEYQLGTVKPDSFPPEIHLSVTGFCNLECRFCSYTQATGRFDFVTVEQIAQLDFLKYVQTLRLHSGLGEPTTNQHLPKIIDYVAQHFPHISINFFTNGLNLNRPGLIDAITGQVRWINVSLNAATRESWQEQCGIDRFNHICQNLRRLLEAKQSKNTLEPLVFGSMVLNQKNLHDLPQMPALCRSLGIDRFTAIPFFALGYNSNEKYGSVMALEQCRQAYDELYEPTIQAAKTHQVSIELPPPSSHKQTSFGLEVRQLYDFAHIEQNEWPLRRFLSRLVFRQPAPTYCHFLWRQAAIGSTQNGGHTPDETHYLYPCLGPLASVDLSRQTSFRFPATDSFLKLWQHPVFSHLREAQHHSGVCTVCDACRQKDTRDPKEFAELESLVAQFTNRFSGLDSL